MEFQQLSENEFWAKRERVKGHDNETSAPKGTEEYLALETIQPSKECMREQRMSNALPTSFSLLALQDGVSLVVFY